MSDFLRLIRAIVLPHTGATLYFDLFPDPPAPDPAVGQAAAASAQTGQGYLDLANKQFDKSSDLGDQQLALAKTVVDQQTQIADENQKQAEDQWSRYNTEFAPVEDQVVKDAMNYDSDANIGLKTSQAAADTTSATNAAQAGVARSLTRRGVNVNSGAYTAGLQPLQVAAAASTAGNMNAARQGVVDRAIGLRAGAASLGRGLPNTAAQAYGLSTNAGSSSVGNENATVANVMQNTGSPTAYAGLGLTGLGQAGSLYNTQFNQAMAGYNANAAQMAGIGNLVGTLGGSFLGAGSGSVGASLFAASSKDYKEGREPIDGDAVLVGLDTLPVDRWRYKKGIADEGEHIGPMAEDTRDRFGEMVAPGGKKIDLISMNGIMLAGLKALNRKVDNKLGGDVEDAVVIGLTPRSRRRETEPARAA